MNPIEQFRKEAGLSREQVAAEIGVDPVTVWRWENGKVLVPPDRLAKVESVTGISRQKLRPDIFGDAA